MEVFNLFQIEFENGMPYIAFLDQARRPRFKAFVTDQLLVIMAQQLPRWVSGYLRFKALGPNADSDVQLRACTVPAKGAETNVDLLQNAVLLGIDDSYNIRIEWQLTPELARGLGNRLLELSAQIFQAREKSGTPS